MTKRIIVVSFVIILSILGAFFYLRPNPSPVVIMCDVGQGDALLVISGYTQLLVDTGPNEKVMECLSEFIPFWDRRIEMVLLSHADKDHIGGMEFVLEKYTVETFIFNQSHSSSDTVKRLKHTLLEENIAIRNTFKGQKISVSTQKEDVSLEILWPEENCVFKASKYSVNTETNYTQTNLVINSCSYDDNQSSISGILTVNGIQILLTGDIDIASELAILATNMLMDVDIIKVSHHGSKSSTSGSFIDMAKPEIGIIGVGKNNQFGHPSTRVNDTLSSRNIKVFRTDLDGHIKILPGVNQIVITTTK